MLYLQKSCKVASNKDFEFQLIDIVKNHHSLII